MKWYVLYTKPKSEKRTALNLEKMGFEVYCPMQIKTRQWSDRKKKVEVPLFNSYIFIKLKEKDRNKVFEAPGVVRYLYWLGKPAVVKEHEIDVIQKWLNDDNFDRVKVQNLNPGDEIEIKSGILKGKSAVVQEVGKKEIRLILKTMGVMVSTKIKEVL